MAWLFLLCPHMDVSIPFQTTAARAAFKVLSLISIHGQLPHKGQHTHVSARQPQVCASRNKERLCPPHAGQACMHSHLLWAPRTEASMRRLCSSAAAF